MLAKNLVGFLEQNTILRTFRAGDAGLDRAQVEFERVGVQRVWLAVHTPEALFFRISLNNGDVRAITTRKFQVANGLAIDREDGAGGTEFG